LKNGFSDPQQIPMHELSFPLKTAFVYVGSVTTLQVPDQNFFRRDQEQAMAAAYD
jgi:hypothetical protein